jgi:hypothetical protein
VERLCITLAAAAAAVMERLVLALAEMAAVAMVFLATRFSMQRQAL